MGPCRTFAPLVFPLLALSSTLRSEASNVPLPYPPKDQIDILKVLFNVTNGRYWTYNTSWTNMLINPCSWYGLSCDEYANVLNLNLQNNNLTGTLPPDLIERLPGVITLNVPSNKLHGALPRFPVGHNVYTVVLSGNNFTGNLIESGVFDTTNLQQIFLESIPHLEVALPVTLSQNINLQELHILGGNMSGTLPSFEGMYNLRQISIIRDNVTSPYMLVGSIPDSLFHNKPHLESVTLLNLGLQGNMPDIVNVPKLIMLNIGNMQLSGTFPSSICGCIFMESLLINNNLFEGTFPPCFTTTVWNTLTTFHIENNQFNGDLSQLNICGLAVVEYFYIGHNSITGVLPDCVTDLHNLKQISIETTSVTGTIPAGLFAMPTIKIIQLSSSFSGTIPDVVPLATLDQLILDGGGSQLTGTIPCSIIANPTLKVFSAKNNQLTGSIPDCFNETAGWTIVNVANNQLTGDIPESLVRSIKVVIPFCIAKNDSVPDNCTKSVFLNNNQFQGKIHTEWTEVLYLSELQLFSNYFSGFIPEEYNDTMLPFLFHKDNSAFFSSNFFLPNVTYSDSGYVPPFAQRMGASGIFWNLDSLDPNMLPTHGTRSVTISGSNFWYSQSKNLRIVWCYKTDQANCSNEISSSSMMTPLDPLTSDNETLVTSSPMQSDIISGLITLGYLADGVLYPISQSWLSFYYYHKSPVVYEASPKRQRWQGCGSITVKGANFSQTPKFKCVFDAVHPRKDNTTAWLNRIVADAIFPPGTTDVVECSIPTFSNDSSPFYDYMSDYYVRVSPNALEDFSALNESVTISFYEWCEVSPSQMGRKCPCGQCECSSGGQCLSFNVSLSSNISFHNLSSVACSCFAGFDGANCETCLKGYYGAYCSKCSECVHGHCEDGKTGSGTCICESKWVGTSCKVSFLFIVIPVGVFGLSCITLIVYQIVKRRNVTPDTRGKRKPVGKRPAAKSGPAYGSMQER